MKRVADNKARIYLVKGKKQSEKEKKRHPIKPNISMS